MSVYTTHPPPLTHTLWSEGGVSSASLHNGHWFHAAQEPTHILVRHVNSIWQHLKCIIFTTLSKFPSDDTCVSVKRQSFVLSKTTDRKGDWLSTRFIILLLYYCLHKLLGSDNETHHTLQHRVVWHAVSIPPSSYGQISDCNSAGWLATQFAIIFCFFGRCLWLSLKMCTISIFDWCVDLYALCLDTHINMHLHFSGYSSENMALDYYMALLVNAETK